MKKQVICLLLTICMLITFIPMEAIASSTLYATPSKTSFVMNTKAVSVTQAYNVNGTNYLQLRALAAMLNGTSAQFNVGWDGEYAVIEPGKPYSDKITETTLKNTNNVRNSSTKFKIDDNIFKFDNSLLIDGDTNYLQLREFAQKLSDTSSRFNVYWDNAAGQAVIVPGVEYTGKAPDEVTFNEEDITWIGTESEYQKTLKVFFDSGLHKVPVGDLAADGSLTNIKYGLVDRYGTFVVKPIYDEIEAKYLKIDNKEVHNEKIFVDGYVQVTKNGKMGLLNSKGVEVIPCKYDAVGLPSEGISRIINKVNGVYYLGYWNVEQGKEIVVPNKYPIDSYYAKAEGNISPWFKRRIISTDRYASDYDFNGGYALVPTGKEEAVTQKYVTGNGHDVSANLIYAQIIDKNGKEVLSGGPYPYREAFMTSSPYPQAGPYMVYQQLSTKRLQMISDHGADVIYDSHLESGVVGPKGIIIPAQYHGGIWGESGKWYPADALMRIIPGISMVITYNCAYEGFGEGAADIGIVNFNNKVVIPFGDGVGGYDSVNKVFYGKYLYNINGTKIPGSVYSGYNRIANGYFHMVDDNSNYYGVKSLKTGTAYINDNLYSKHGYTYTTSESRSNVSISDTIWIKKDFSGVSKWGLVNLQGNVLLPFEYEEIHAFDDNWEKAKGAYAIVKKNGKWGVVDTTGKEILPCIYGSISETGDGYFSIMDYNTKKYGLYSLNARKITISCIYSNNIRLASYSTGTGHIGTVSLKVDNSLNAMFDVDTGKQISPTVLGMTPISSGLYYSTYGDEYGPDGKIVFPRTEKLNYYNGKQIGVGEDLTLVAQDGKVGYVNASRLAREGKSLPTTPRVKPTPVPVKSRYYLVQYPSKLMYMVGDSFDITGLIVHYSDDAGIRSVVDSSKLTFYTSDTVELKQGRPFVTDGVKVIEIRYNNEKVDTFEVKVISTNSESVLEPGDYYMQIYGKYIYPVPASGIYWMELSDKKPDKPFTVKLLNYSDDKGPMYSISYDGTYIGQPSSTDGNQLQSSLVPHMWRINKYSSFCTIRDYGKQKLTVNASGEKSSNGTKVIVWSSTGSVPENAKINFIDAATGKSINKSGVEIKAYPTKTSYKVGEGFDVSGLNVIDNETNINDKITFWTSGTVELTQGRPFQTAGTKEIQLHYNGKTIGSYTINVTD